jgi:DNA-binding response OmpR family regulator
MPKILIIDNSDDACKIYSDTLRCAGYEVDYITDEEKAIELVSKKKPDVVLLDVLMPKINGLHILNMITKDTGNKKTKTVMLTNVDDTDIREKARRYGADDYIVKTETNMSELLQRIDKVLST